MQLASSRRYLCRIAIAVIVAGCSVHDALAQDTYPNHTIRMVVPFPAGGSADILTRVVTQEMSDILGQPIIVENRTGAGGNIGAEAVAKSPPDGYTLLSGSSSLPLAGSLFSKLSYDPMKDFTSVTMIGSSPMIMTVYPGFPVKTVPELIALAKQKPGEITYASAGYGSMNQLAMELFKIQAGIDMRHVPYRGNSLAAIDAIGGNVSVFTDYVLTGLPNVRDGKLRALATTAATRLPSLPDVPTVAEAALPGFEASLWFAFFAPAGTPAPVVNKLDETTRTALSRAAVKGRLAELGIYITPRGPEDLGRIYFRDFERWKSVVEKVGIKLD